MAILQEFKPAIAPGAFHPDEAWWFIFSGYQLLLKVAPETAEVPSIRAPETLGVEITRRLHLGSFRGHSCYAAEGRLLDRAPTGVVFQELRNLFGVLDRGFYEVALTAIHLIEWDKRSQFCGRCRGVLKSRSDIRAKECDDCGHLEFPRISPAIIVLIQKENSLLLARSARFPGAFFSVLAGFVEPGESLEDAVHREVKEETGLSIKNIAYFGSQPWPFPDSLMIGFTSEYESGEIRIDGEEIVEAGWFRCDALPQIPGKLSIARALIDWFVQKHS